MEFGSGRSRDWCLMRKLAGLGAAFLFVFAVVLPVVDRALLPEPEPGPEYYPPEGFVFKSELEGFTQRIVKREAGLLWVELTFDPHAEGPPAHVHTSFPERFHVAEGSISLLIDGEVVVVEVGEEGFVPSHTIHKPYNPNNVPAVVAGPLTRDYALPDEFGVFLTQAYGFFDESPKNSRPPRALFQMSRFSPRYDSWLGGPPIGLQRALFWVLGPVARILGYRSYYPRFAPKEHLGDGEEK